jgi:hypothetical protein
MVTVSRTVELLRLGDGKESSNCLEGKGSRSRRLEVGGGSL